MQPFAGNGLLVSKQELWQHRRKILMKTQNYQNLKVYVEMLNRHSKKFVDELQILFADGHSYPINDKINVLFLKLICGKVIHIIKFEIIDSNS